MDRTESFDRRVVSIKPATMDNTWKKLGFLVETKGDHIRANLWVHGQWVVKTRRSHGAKGMKGNVPHLIRQQMHLDEDQFRNALKCPLQADGYLEILRDKGHLESPSESAT